MEPAGELRIKGLAFRSVLAALEDLRGRAFHDQVMAALEGEGGEALRHGALVASGWYPIRWYRDLLAGIERAGSADLPRLVGRESARRDITTVHRLIFRLMSPETVVQQSQRLFRLFYDGGDVRVLEARKGFARVRYTGCFGFDRLVWQDFLGGCETVLETAGAKGLHISIQAGGDGPTLVADSDWQ